jgi:hypothetical protein
MKNQFTCEDLKVLQRQSSSTSVLSPLLVKYKFNPEKFENLLKVFPKEYDFVFNVPYEDLPLKINDQTINGYLQWRLTIGK